MKLVARRYIATIFEQKGNAAELAAVRVRRDGSRNQEKENNTTGGKEH